MKKGDPTDIIREAGSGRRMKMRILTKINRGAILFTIVLITVIVYLVATGAAQAAEKPDIKDICTRYVGVEISYRMLPAKYRVTVPAITQAEKEDYIAQMRTDIAAFYPSGAQSIKYITDMLAQGIESQASGKGIVIELKKTITEFTAIVFDGNTATVDMKVNTTYNGPESAGATGLPATVVGETSDAIILQKIGGTWKVVYSNLNLPVSNNGPVGPMIKF
jgi:hypothetical protein